MAKNLYVTSTQTYSGKSALCVGMLRRFQRDGFKIGYMKPVSTTINFGAGDRMIDEDCLFIKDAFGLSDALENMSPVLLNDRQVMAVLGGEEPDFAERVRLAYQSIAKGKDIVVMEGGGSLRDGWMIDLAPPRVSEMLDAAKLVVVPYENDQQVVDDLITAKKRLGDPFVGSVINRIPSHRVSFARDQIEPFVRKRDIPVLATLPREQLLTSITVAELREGLGGEVLCGHQGLEGMVESVMVGAMNVDSALTYFRRKPNKAVITGGDRPDIQLAALETSTRCIILTGNLRPSPMIIGRAEDLGVPIIMTCYDTFSVVESVERFFGKTRFHESKKVERFDELLEKYMDFKTLYAALGL